MILPNLAALSDRQCTQLQNFVESGGGLVATHQTSLADEWGRPRPDFGLAPLFGASYAGNVIERQQNAYVHIEDRKHPLLDGLGDAGRFIHGVARVEVKPLGKDPAPLTTMPSYPDLPMEEVYLRAEKTDIPAVFWRSQGKGRVVYFPWDIDRTFWEVMSTDHGRLLANAVRWATGSPQPVEVSGPGVVDLAVWEQQGSMTVHLVNLTNPMMMKGPFREILPVGPQKIRVQAKAPKTARWLAGGTAAKVSARDGWVEAVTPPIGLHEVLALEY
jgi:type 1 glutamine amidotransferase